MSVFYTTAPQAADYEWTVQESTIVPCHMPGWRPRPEAPMRRVVLDDRENGYYRDYQVGRYHSFGVVVISEEQWERDLAAGYITLEASDG